MGRKHHSTDFLSPDMGLHAKHKKNRLSVDYGSLKAIHIQQAILRFGKLTLEFSIDRWSRH